MSRTIPRLILALASVLASHALAADMAACNASTRAYRVLPNEDCWVLCDGMGTGAGGTTATTKCGPKRLPLNPNVDYDELTWVVPFGASNCLFAAPFVISWLQSPVDTDTTTLQGFVTLTGVDSASTSSVTKDALGGAYWEMNTTALADTDCNTADANGNVGIAVIVKARKRHK
jgi:hypothetical protein